MKSEEMSGTIGIKDHVSDKETESDKFYKEFEPKLNDRFVVYMEDVPVYLINKVMRPIVSVEDDKYIYSDLILELYDPITPSATQIFTEFERKGKTTFDKIILSILGPIGDEVEKWVYKNCKIKTVEHSKLDWANSHPISLTVTLSFEEAIHEF